MNFPSFPQIPDTLTEEQQAHLTKINLGDAADADTVDVLAICDKNHMALGAIFSGQEYHTFQFMTSLAHRFLPDGPIIRGEELRVRTLGIGDPFRNSEVNEDVNMYLPGYEPDLSVWRLRVKNKVCEPSEGFAPPGYPLVEFVTRDDKTDPEMLTTIDDIKINSKRRVEGLGSFKLDKFFKWEGEVAWFEGEEGTHSVSIVDLPDVTHPDFAQAWDDAVEVIKELRRDWDSKWNDAMLQRAVDDLFQCYNDNWTDEDNPKRSEEEYRSLITFSGLEYFHDPEKAVRHREFRIWTVTPDYKLFTDHNVIVRASLDEGCTEASF